MSEYLLKYENVEKSFFGVRVLRKVSFGLRQDHVLGLVGENGAGKSTLMNILGGVLRADAGRIVLDGKDYAPKNPAEALKHGVAFIHQELNLFTNLSIAENIFIAGFPHKKIAGISMINKRAVRDRTERLLEQVDLHLSPDQLVENLSQGERQLVEIAKALSTEAKIIIFDEPTTSLTTRETERLFLLIERLRSRGISMIYISHILGDIFRLCDEIVVLRDGAVVGEGTKDDFTLEALVSLMVGRSLDQLYPPRTSSPQTEIALEVKGLSQTGVIENITFALRKGEILGIAGLMGSGRSELARILFGLDPYERGEIWINGNLVKDISPKESIRRGMAFLTEDRREEGLLMDASIAENIALVSLPAFTSAGFVNRETMDQAVSRVADTVKIRSASLTQQAVKSLSGGNQQKVVLAKWLMNRPSIVLLDEPTRGIDVGAKHEIYRLINELAAQGTAMLLISSEIEELIGMCDRIMVMKNGEIAGRFEQSEFDREKLIRAALSGNGLL